MVLRRFLVTLHLLRNTQQPSSIKPLGLLTAYLDIPFGFHTSKITTDVRFQTFLGIQYEGLIVLSGKYNPMPERLSSFYMPFDCKQGFRWKAIPRLKRNFHSRCGNLESRQDLPHIPGV